MSGRLSGRLLFFKEKIVFSEAKGFVRKGCAGQLAIAILPQFLAINLISCERVAPDNLKSQFYVSFWRSNLISCERVAFRAVSLARLRAFKREIEKKERARGQERRCEDEQSENVKMNVCNLKTLELIGRPL